MRRLNWYLVRNLLFVMIMAIGITTFMGLIGSFAQIFGLIAKGIPLSSLLLSLVYRLPRLLTYTIPVGILVSTILVFNQLSANNELTVLRASGISLLEITAPLILVSIVAAGLCFLLQFYLGPSFYRQSQVLLRRMEGQAPLALIEPRTFMEFQRGLLFYVGAKDGDTVREIRIYRLDENDRPREDISAARGQLALDPTEQRLILSLHDVHILRLDSPGSGPAKVQRIDAAELNYPIELGASFTNRRLTARPVDMTLPELLANIRIETLNGGEPTRYYTLLHQRAAVSLAPFSFLLLGIPFGIRLGRKENSLGLLASLGIAVLYYSAIVAVDALAKSPSLHPELLMWIPNVLCQAGGIAGLWLKR